MKMKRLLILALLPAVLAGCYNSNPRAGGGSRGTFAQQYAELEQQPVQPTQFSDPLPTADERYAQVAIDAQKERRAQAPIVESNYLFRVMPPNKSVYSYDEYNEVWTGEPKERDYTKAKRLWTKPKRYSGYEDGPAPAAPAPAAADYSDEAPY